MTDEAITITVDQLRSYFRVLIDHLDTNGIDSLELKHDYFWSIDQHDLYNVYDYPKNLTVGQLSEALEHLERIRSGERPPLGYALVWLAHVLQALGHDSIG